VTHAKYVFSMPSRVRPSGFMYSPCQMPGTKLQQSGKQERAQSAHRDLPYTHASMHTYESGCTTSTTWSKAPNGKCPPSALDYKSSFKYRDGLTRSLGMAHSRWHW
jgi:hypothetical protein